VTTLVLFVGWLALGVWAGGCVALVRASYAEGQLRGWGSLLIPVWPLLLLWSFWLELRDGTE
jgi:hypothetical protein